MVKQRRKMYHYGKKKTKKKKKKKKKKNMLGVAYMNKLGRWREQTYRRIICQKVKTKSIVKNK